MIIRLGSGVGFVLRGFKLIRHPGIRRYVIIPLIINIVLFAGIIWYGASEFEVFLNWMLSFLPTWLSWLEWILWPIFAIATVLIVFYLFTPVANFIGAPFNALLSEKLELQLSGKPLSSSGDITTLLQEIPKTLLSEVKKLAYLLLWMIPLLILFVIPGINLLAPFIWFIFGAWMLALEYADYPMGNHNMRFQQQRELLRQNRSLALGFGGAVTLMTIIPILNFFAMPVGVAGATAMWVDKLKPQAPITNQALQPQS